MNNNAFIRNWVERIRRETIEAIGLRLGTTLPVEVVRSPEP